MEKMLEEGKFECLFCDHVETDKQYLADEAWLCRECGDSLYYWPYKETREFSVSINYPTMTPTIKEENFGGQK